MNWRNLLLSLKERAYVTFWKSLGCWGARLWLFGDGSSRGDADLCLPCGAPGSYCFGKHRTSPSAPEVRKEHHLSLSSVQCALLAWLAPPLAKGEEGQQSQAPAFLFHPPHSRLENREKRRDLGTKKRNRLYPQRRSAFSCVTCCTRVWFFLPGELSCPVTARHAVPGEFNFEKLKTLTETPWCCVAAGPRHVKGSSFRPPVCGFITRWM